MKALTDYLTPERASDLWLAWHANQLGTLPERINGDPSAFLEEFSSKPPKRASLLKLMFSEGLYPSSIRPEEWLALTNESEKFAGSSQLLTFRATVPPPPAPASSSQTSGIDVYFEICGFLERGLDPASWNILAHYLSVEPFALPALNGGNPHKVWERLRAKDEFYADLSIGYKASDAFRDAVAKLAIPGKQELLQKIEHFRTVFCGCPAASVSPVDLSSPLKKPAAQPSAFSAAAHSVTPGGAPVPSEPQYPPPSGLDSQAPPTNNPTQAPAPASGSSPGEAHQPGAAIATQHPSIVLSNPSGPRWAMVRYRYSPKQFDVASPLVVVLKNTLGQMLHFKDGVVSHTPRRDYPEEAQFELLEGAPDGRWYLRHVHTGQFLSPTSAYEMKLTEDMDHRSCEFYLHAMSDTSGVGLARELDRNNSLLLPPQKAVTATSVYIVYQKYASDAEYQQAVHTYPHPLDRKSGSSTSTPAPLPTPAPTPSATAAPAITLIPSHASVPVSVYVKPADNELYDDVLRCQGGLLFQQKLAEDIAGVDNGIADLGARMQKYCDRIDVNKVKMLAKHVDRAGAEKLLETFGNAGGTIAQLSKALNEMNLVLISHRVRLNAQWLMNRNHAARQKIGNEMFAALALTAMSPGKAQLFQPGFHPEACFFNEDFLPFEFLQRGTECGEAVCAIVRNKVHIGTGWLCALNQTHGVIITCWHVIPGKEALNSAEWVAWFHFNSSDDESPGYARRRTVKLTAWVTGSPTQQQLAAVTQRSRNGVVFANGDVPLPTLAPAAELDYAIVLCPLEGFVRNGVLACPQPLALGAARNHLAHDKHINIIQHPGGGKPKQIAIRLGDVTQGGLLTCLRYTTRTEGGSSGSPVFDDDWQLQGLHQAACPAGRRYHHPGVMSEELGYNQAVSIGTIVQHLIATGYENLVVR